MACCTYVLPLYKESHDAATYSNDNAYKCMHVYTYVHNIYTCIYAGNSTH